MKISLFLIIFFLTQSQALAHTFTGMKGYFDGISHPVLGLDHFLAMISVGIISSQIGNKAIWSIPTTFVGIMIVGGVMGIYIELHQLLESAAQNNIHNQFISSSLVNLLIEIGILLSVIFLGTAIALQKNFSTLIIMIAVGIFGFFHGCAHGLEIPWASNPIFFLLGFITGTGTLHLFGVIIGYFSLKKKLTNILIRLAGLCFAFIGLYSIINL